MSDRGAILLAEDRDDDILLIQKALQRGGIRNPLYVVRNGDETIRYLSGDIPFSDRSKHPLPSLLLLDLKMPGTDGFEVLRWIKTRPELTSLRTVMLTSSENVRDMDVAYKLGASSFLVKSIDFENTVELAKAMAKFWL